MLTELHIKNFALIDEVYLSFDKGLTILTGETGAGKTLIIEAMNLILGKRADPILIGPKGDEALVEASFSHPELILSRLVSKEGKNRCYVNGKLATLSMLAEIGEDLVDFHGQHEHQVLLKIPTHLDYLDRFGGEELLDLKDRFEQGYQELKGIERERESLSLSERERVNRIDLLKFQVDEIEKANLVADEEESLHRERMLLQNAEKLYAAVDSAYRSLQKEEVTEAGAIENLQMAVDSLSSIAEIDEVPRKMAETLETCLYEIQELAHALREYRDSVQFDPQRLQEVEERLSQITLLEKKYGGSIAEMLKFQQEARAELARLEGSASRLEELDEIVAGRQSRLREMASSLSMRRKKVASRLEEEVEEELKELNLKNCRFEVGLDSEEGLTSHGIDRVEFMISPNVGEDLKPLVKIASGGEISRIMLALKISLVKADPVPILIFDEVDQGIGGKTAAAVGSKLAYLSNSHQIITITHLPQIASFADRHFVVSKKVHGKATETTVEVLDSRGKREELARMLSGVGVSDITKKHAEELLATATAEKHKVRVDSE
ncbi:MAG: DNA repair protein RecN [Actinomycetota bacterium]